MSETNGGVFIRFEPERTSRLRERTEWPGRFSVELSSSDWPSFGSKGLFLLALSDDPGDTDCVAIGRHKRGPRNTGAYNLEFSDFVFFEPINVDALRAQLPATARSVVKVRENGRGLWFPPTAWLALIQVLSRERPDVAGEIERLLRRVAAQDPIDRPKHAERLAQQRDAIGLSLDVAGLSTLRRERLRKARLLEGDNTASSFISMMDAQAPQERSLIEHDRGVFESVIATGEYSTAGFSEGPRSLRVWTVDKHQIERFAGVDLVIYNADYNSLLMIQYKCMEPGRDSEKEWRYRPNAGFWDECTRLRKVRGLIKQRMPKRARTEDERLNMGALYFKFCKRLPLSKQDGELAEGMLMGVGETLRFLRSHEARGPKGGESIGYDNCERYMTNTLFAALARDGWIGSRGLSAEDYREVLGILKRDDTRSLVLAETHTAIEPGQSRSLRRARGR